MGIYRQMQTGYWSDPFVFELTAEETYGYIYLMTNDKTTQCGIYELSVKRMSMELKCGENTVEETLKKLQENGKIIYCDDTKEIMILNWMKYNFINSKNTMMCINKELKAVKNKGFIQRLYEICVKLKYETETMFRGIHVMLEKQCESENYNESIKDKNMDFQGAYMPLEEEETKEKEEIINKKEEFNKELDSSGEYGRGKEYFENNSENRILTEFNRSIRQATEDDQRKIRSLLQDFPEEVIIKAIHEGVKHKAQHPKYIWSILNNWKTKGLFTADKFNNHADNDKGYTNLIYNRSNTAAYKYVD